MWMLVEDFNGDGINDVLISEQVQFAMVHGKADGTLDELNALTVTGHASEAYRVTAALIEPPTSGDAAADDDATSQRNFTLSGDAAQRIIFEGAGNRFGNTLPSGYITSSNSFQSTVAFTPLDADASFDSAWMKQLAVADVDGDGDDDVVAADHRGKRIFLYLNHGNGGFKPARVIATSPNDLNTPAVAIVDINRDGRPDVIFAEVSYGDFGSPFTYENLKKIQTKNENENNGIF
jgi:hypothetical protein